MAEQVKKPERVLSLTITIRVNSISQADAQTLEDAIRDVADDYQAEVNASRGAERPALR